MLPKNNIYLFIRWSRYKKQKVGRQYVCIIFRLKRKTGRYGVEGRRRVEGRVISVKMKRERKGREK